MDKIKKGIALLKKAYKHQGFRARVMYALLQKYVKIDNETIFYESHHAKSMTCNPYAMFLFILNDSRFLNYTHVWILENPSLITQWRQDNVKLIKKNSFLHMYYLLKSKYFINNTTFMPYVNMKENQVYINTWHGTPLKTLGKDVKFSYGNSRNVCKNLLQTDYFISPNKYTTDIFLSSNDLDNLYTGLIIENGYPRIDLSFSSEEDKNSLYNELNISHNKKTILYAPTFRGSHIGTNSNDQIFTDFVTMLEKTYSEKYNILIKLHHINSKKKLNIKILPDSYDSNLILGITDILITDYSSIAFDFLALKKPIIYYAFDLDNYLKSRGTYFDIKEMPGKICYDETDVINTLNSIDSFMINQNEKYEKAIEKFAKYEDGNVTKKVIETIFFNDTKATHNYRIKALDKKKILIYGGAFLNNGVTASLVALLSNIDYAKYDIYLIANINVKSKNFLRTKERIPSNVKMIYMIDSFTKLFQSSFEYLSLEKLEKIFQNENYKYFGNADFDIAIDYSGYGSYWASMIAFSNAKLKSIYLHSDMKKEYEKRPNLIAYKLLSKLYTKKYDRLITVSESSYQENIHNFTNLKEKIYHVDNLIDANKIIKLSQEKSYLVENSFDESKTNFINIGRYSVEKGQGRLIQAFSKLIQTNQNIHLYIVGHGPLHKKLKLQIENLGLESYITLTGNKDNPFALLKRCDCFVLSSHYEGQGLVLLESLVLNIPCISTNIPGPQSILNDENGLLVEDSTQGLLNGMKSFLNNEVPIKEFNHEKYTQNALNSFYRAID